MIILKLRYFVICSKEIKIFDLDIINYLNLIAGRYEKIPNYFSFCEIYAKRQKIYCKFLEHKMTKTLFHALKQAHYFMLQKYGQFLKKSRIITFLSTWQKTLPHMIVRFSLMSLGNNFQHIFVWTEICLIKQNSVWYFWNIKYMLVCGHKIKIVIVLCPRNVIRRF